MRIAIAGISHETNTFSHVPADYAAFEKSGTCRGDEIVNEFKESHSTIAGYLQAADELGFEAVPLMFARTGPIGTITKDAYDRLTAEIVQMLKDRGPWDAVLLANHGAAVSAEYHDADGETAARVRAAVGPDVPIGQNLDMHVNLTQKMVENVNVTTIYRTTPHLDPKPRARECAELIYRAVKGEIRPVQALETPPMIINILKHFTGEEPMKGFMADARAVEERPGVLTASVAEGYPYADVPEMGMAFVTVADGDEAAARDAARWMAKRAWDRRAEIVGDSLSPEEALKYADAAPKGPICLMDVGDNIGGGSSADSTVLLAAAKKLGIGNMLQSLFDPEAVDACVAAGVGSDLTLTVGGKTDDMHGEPVEVTGHVRVISDGLYEELEPIHGGFRFFNAGTMVALDTTDGHTVVLTSRRTGNTSRQQMYSLGIRPERYKIVVAKGVQSPRPAYEPISVEVVMVNTPGVTTSDLSFFDYKRRRVPLYPFEEDAGYE